MGRKRFSKKDDGLPMVRSERLTVGDCIDSFLEMYMSNTTRPMYRRYINTIIKLGLLCRSDMLSHIHDYDIDNAFSRIKSSNIPDYRKKNCSLVLRSFYKFAMHSRSYPGVTSHANT